MSKKYFLKIITKMNRHITTPLPFFQAESELSFLTFLQTVQGRRSLTAAPMWIGIGGPGGSGKSVLSRYIAEKLGNCPVLALDDFRLPRAQRPAHAPFGSHPDAVDTGRLHAVLTSARRGEALRQPHFDRVEGRVLHETQLPTADFVLIDGEITAYELMAPYLDYFILVHSSLPTQLRARLQRDRGERNCSLFKTLRIFIRSNLIDHPRFAKKAKARAACIFYRQRDNRLRLTHLQL